jgi:hypothetical protein
VVTVAAMTGVTGVVGVAGLMLSVRAGLRRWLTVAVVAVFAMVGSR